MPLFRRVEGEYLGKVSSLRRLMPHLMPGRNESIVFFEQQFELTGTLAYLKRRAADPEGPHLTFFHVVLAALVRIFHERPQMNRFVVGRRLYQRKGIELSFAVKKKFHDEAPLTTVKITFEPTDTLEDVARRVEAAIGVGRGEAQTGTEKEMGFFTALPRSVLRFSMWLQGVLDYFNLLPGAMIRPDPLYASMFLANLGSVGIDAPFHHLYEYGTTPLFGTIGKIHKAPVVTPEGELAVRDVVKLRYSFDERIADGFYCARSLELFQRLVEAPEALERTV